MKYALQVKPQLEMSHTHIRVARPAAARKPWLERLFFSVAAVLAMLTVFLILWDRPREPFVVEHGQILETRIMVDSILQGRFGGRIHYRLEARVSYDLAGSRQHRWMTADTLSASHEVIAAQAAGNPKNCLVYWEPDHPENARCHME